MTYCFMTAINIISYDNCQMFEQKMKAASSENLVISIQYIYL